MDAEAPSSSTITSIAFCGGASGGHISPALAIAEELVRRFPRVALHWLGSARDVERRMLAECSAGSPPVSSPPQPVVADIPRLSLFITEVAPARPFSFLRRPLSSCWHLLRGVIRARAALRAARPDVVLGSGGYASLPGILAAGSLSIPIVLFEPNAVAGRANRGLSRLAKEMLTACPLADEARIRCATEPVGIPMRRAIADAARGQSAKKERLLLVLGGSQGAAFLNQTVPRVLSSPLLTKKVADWRVLHQCGRDCESEVSEAYRTVDLKNIEVSEFISDMPRVLREASVVITRGGAITLAEIAECQARAIVVPMVPSADDHQMANARRFGDVYGFQVVDESATDAEKQLVAAVAESLAGNSQVSARQVDPIDPANTPVRRAVDRLIHHAFPSQSRNA